MRSNVRSGKTNARIEKNNLRWGCAARFFCVSLVLTATAAYHPGRLSSRLREYRISSRLSRKGPYQGESDGPPLAGMSLGGARQG